ncbi:MAG TPA: N-acetylmuramidase domain-containing protein [Myxococcota bacterium]
MALFTTLGGLGDTDDVLASRAGIPVRILRAIRLLESGGRPSATRFEPHVFNRLTQNRYASQIPFTRDPVRRVSLVRSETNRAAFERASRFDREAAIRATSWGLYQVLGGHLLSVASGEPVAYFDRDPETVSAEMLASWFRSRPAAVRAAQAGNISELARLYNGSQRWGNRLTAILESGRADVARRASTEASAAVETVSKAFNVTREKAATTIVPVLVVTTALAVSGTLAYVAWRRMRR